MLNSVFENFLRRVYDAINIQTQNELASVLGVNRSAVTQARKKDSIPDKWILKLFRLYGLNPDWLESGMGDAFVSRGRHDSLSQVPVPKVKARLCAGGGSFEADAEVTGYCSFQSRWLEKKGEPSKMVLMDIFGNSMEPEMKNGDTVLIDQSQKNILAGAVYAVGVEDTIMVKRVEKHPHRLVLLSDNTDYAPIYLTAEDSGSVRIIGKVVWLCRELR